MRTFTIDDIRKLGPCYDPVRYLPKDWQGTALDILRLKDCPAEDRLWVVLSEGWIDDRTLHLFAVWCTTLGGPSTASWAVGEAARSAAWAAIWAADRDAVKFVAWAAAWDAAWVAQIEHLIEMLEESERIER